MNAWDQELKQERSCRTDDLNLSECSTIKLQRFEKSLRQSLISFCIRLLLRVRARLLATHRQSDLREIAERGSEYVIQSFLETL